MRWLLLVLAVALVACNGGGGENPLADTQWRLVAMGNARAPAATIDDVTAAFTETGLDGWTACNAYAARYSVRGSELRLENLRWTEAGCPTQELFEQEQRMQELLAAVTRFELSGDLLTIGSESGPVLVFERAA